MRVIFADVVTFLADNDWSTYYLLHLDVTWAQVYETEPLAGITDPAERALVLGGELCKWGESTDASVFDGKVWSVKKCTPVHQPTCSYEHVAFD